MPRATGRALGLMAILLATVGCESLPSSRVRPAPPPEKRAAAWKIDHDAYETLGYRLDWRGFPAVSAGKATIQVVDVMEDMIVVLDRSSLVSALKPSDGSTVWRNEVANPLTHFKGVGRANDRVAVVSDSDVYLIDPMNGTIVDRQTLDRVANTKPLIGGEAIIYGTSSGEIRLHSTRARIEIWGNALYGQTAPGAVRAAPIFVEGVIGAVSDGGAVFFIDPSAGSLVAKNNIEGAVVSNPVSEGSVMYVASLDQSIYAFSSTSGAQLWRYRTSTPLRAQPAVHDGVLYCHVPGQGMTALDATKGTVKWTSPDVDGEIICLANGALVCWDAKTVTRLDPATGHAISRLTLEGVSKIIPDGFVDPALYVVGERGVLAKFTRR
jgi:outer membrane protein assembly factor BamB